MDTGLAKGIFMPGAQIPSTQLVSTLENLSLTIQATFLAFLYPSPLPSPANHHSASTRIILYSEKLASQIDESHTPAHPRQIHLGFSHE